MIQLWNKDKGRLATRHQAHGMSPVVDCVGVSCIVKAGDGVVEAEKDVNVLAMVVSI